MSAPVRPDGVARLGHLPQIDLMKAVAAVAVVLLHSLSRDALTQSWAVFHIWQAVPVFVLLMGLTTRISYERRHVQTLSVLASDIPRRLRRLVVPFSIAWGASLLLGLSRHDDLYFGVQTLLCRLPGPGRGSYFVSLAISFAMLAPVLFRLLIRWPTATLLASAAVNIAFELMALHLDLFADPWIYAVTPLRYLLLFVLGMWLADDLPDPQFTGRASIVVPYALLSVVYLVAWNTGWYVAPFLVQGWSSQNPAAYGYTMLLCVLGLRMLPCRPGGPTATRLGRLGRASYHIFLTQMIVVVMAPTWVDWRIVGNVLLSCLIGWLWFELESRGAPELAARRG